MRKIFLTLISCGLLAACGGRVSHPVDTTTPYDSRLSCDHIQAELVVNQKHIDDLFNEKDDDENNNVGMLVIAPLFMDLSDSEKIEVTALQKRNDVLIDLKKHKNCQ
jgi:hypothetical protein